MTDGSGIRVAPNSHSLASRAKPIAADLGRLAAEGHYDIRLLCWLDDAPAHNPAAAMLDVFPVGYLPTWSSTICVTDKAGQAVGEAQNG